MKTLGIFSPSRSLRPSRSILFGLLLGTALTAQAGIDAFHFDTPKQEDRFQQLTSELRCLVCQNQSLADSNADLALDLRRQVHQMILAGKSDTEIVDYMVNRYGDFVLYRPPVRPGTWMLWFGPAVLLGGGAVGVAVFVRRRRSALAETLSDEERVRLAALLDQEKRP